MRRNQNRDEDGFAMVVAVILLTVVATLGTVIMVSSNHTATATGKGRSWVQALDVAEAGVQDAQVRLASTPGYTGTFSGTTSEGSFSTTVTPVGRAQYKVVSSGTVGQTSSLQGKRKIQVTLAPPESFKAALFSYTSIDTKNNDHIVGDVWANQNVTVDQNDIVDGNITAATGYLYMRIGSDITKDVVTGGYDSSDTDAVYMDNSARIDGNVVDSVTAPTDPVTCGNESQNNYSVRMNTGSSIGGSVTTWGSKNGPGTIGGALNQNVCTAAPAALPMPVYSYNAGNYDAATLHEFGTPAAASSSALSNFNAWLSSNLTHLHGTVTVFQTGVVSQSNRIDLTGGVVDGDLTLISNLPIFTNNITDAASVTDAIAMFASTYQPAAGTSCDVNHDSSDCAVHIKNNFQPSGKTACLVYAPYGPVAIKNNQAAYGAVYAANIQIKNNQTLTYDPRVDRIVGFGPATLVRSNWRELTP